MKSIKELEKIAADYDKKAAKLRTLIESLQGLLNGAAPKKKRGPKAGMSEEHRQKIQAAAKKRWAKAKKETPARKMTGIGYDPGADEDESEA